MPWSTRKLLVGLFGTMARCRTTDLGCEETSPNPPNRSKKAEPALKSKLKKDSGVPRLPDLKSAATSELAASGGGGKMKGLLLRYYIHTLMTTQGGRRDGRRTDAREDLAPDVAEAPPSLSQLIHSRTAGPTTSSSSARQLEPLQTLFFSEPSVLYATRVLSGPAKQPQWTESGKSPDGATYSGTDVGEARGGVQSTMTTMQYLNSRKRARSPTPGFPDGGGDHPDPDFRAPTRRAQRLASHYGHRGTQSARRAHQSISSEQTVADSLRRLETAPAILPAMVAILDSTKVIVPLTTYVAFKPTITTPKSRQNKGQVITYELDKNLT
ncbi:hypothetical protein EDB86DRAFT_2831969 [Lactarius hatsudake]|nr:hypothetical protein EDB86DRAFT_2831969 [Lactarius hatsudake]